MNIFVANMSFRIQSEDLKQLFKEYGEVQTAKIVSNRETGKSKGYGFVEMPNDDQALKAINELNEAEYDGNIIVVKKAKPREEHNRSKRMDQNRVKKPFKKEYSKIQ